MAIPSKSRIWDLRSVSSLALIILNSLTLTLLLPYSLEDGRKHPLDAPPSTLHSLTSCLQTPILQFLTEYVSDQTYMLIDLKLNPRSYAAVRAPLHPPGFLLRLQAHLPRGL